MSTKDFLYLVEQECVEPILEQYEDIKRNDLEIIQVWYCKTIQNHKGLFIIKHKQLDIIYPYFIEATYNGDLKEIYLDFYSKNFKHTISI